jgi:hypothetical protein
VVKLCPPSSSAHAAQFLQAQSHPSRVRNFVTNFQQLAGTGLLATGTPRRADSFLLDVSAEQYGRLLIVVASCSDH